MFKDRSEAGRALAHSLQQLRDRAPVIVALPRGGVPVGFEVALALDAPLDVVVARKLGAPGHPEYGIGAVAEGGALYLDTTTIARLGVTPEHLQTIVRQESAELLRRVRAYRGDHPPVDIAGRTVIVVDDGMATGVTVRAAIRSLRARGPRTVVIAAPVCAAESARELLSEVDAIVCAHSPEDFLAVSSWYGDFAQTTDDEVRAILALTRRDANGSPSARPPRTDSPR
ncbi:MAG: phosphoribosyltransferase [Polyangiales bacterium]